jgi:hypothetical protein
MSIKIGYRIIRIGTAHELANKYVRGLTFETVRLRIVIACYSGS